MSDQPTALEHEPVGPANEPDPVNTAGVSGSQDRDQILASLLQLVKQVSEKQEKLSEKQEKLSEAVLDIKETLKAEPEKISISQVSWNLAHSILQQLKIPLNYGHETDPLETDNTTFPYFSMANFDGEEAATPPALKYIQQCLLMCNVKFGENGFKLCDTHKEKHLYQLAIGNKVFQGGVDGVLVPYGVAPIMPQPQLRAAIELKYSQKHKALYNQKNYGKSLSGQPQGTMFSGTVRGQAILETLAGLVSTEHPEIMLLVTDIDFNTVIKYEAGKLTYWDDVSFNQAIHKLAKFLNSCDADREYSLEQAMRSMSGAAAATLEPTVELRKKLRPNSSLLLEQLESVLDPDMSFNERLATAMQLIQAHRPCHEECSTSSDSWKSMFG